MRAIFDGRDNRRRPTYKSSLRANFQDEAVIEFFRFLFFVVFLFYFRRQRDIIYYIKKAEKGRAKDTTTTADFLANNGNRSTRIQLLYGTPRPRTVLNLLETGQKAHCSVNLAGIITVVDITIIIGVILGVGTCVAQCTLILLSYYFKFKRNTHIASVRRVDVAKIGRNGPRTFFYYNMHTSDQLTGTALFRYLLFYIAIIISLLLL